MQSSTMPAMAAWSLAKRLTLRSRLDRAAAAALGGFWNEAARNTLALWDAPSILTFAALSLAERAYAQESSAAWPWRRFAAKATTQV
jgi:hypothetical protein